MMWRNYPFSSNRCVQRETIMPVFKSPRYSKVHNPSSGVIEPSYIFDISFQNNDTSLEFVCDESSLLTLSSLQNYLSDHTDWWINFLQQFLNFSSKMFSKPYTVQHLLKVVKHNSLQGTEPESFPVNVSFLPKTIQIISGNFLVNWEYTTTPIVIDIPVMEEPDVSLSTTSVSTLLPDLDKVVDDIEELNMDELPEEKDTTDNSVPLDHTNRLYDKQKVKEARLKAKLAVYRAQYQLNRYYEKYGDEISDSDTETDYEISDEEEDNEDEKDDIDVQL
jgi:hypothetical protein